MTRPTLYKEIPTDLKENLRWRFTVNERCARDKAFRDAMWSACASDTMFFLNGFCWVYEPRPRKVDGVLLPKQMPFIGWTHQVPAIQDIEEDLGMKDIGVEKSRGEGASWIGVLLATKDFIFEPMSSIGLVSKDERSADDPKNPDSLMWKIDWELTKLPTWMAGEKNVNYKRDVTNHVLLNLDNKSTITGFAATGNVASGGRKSWFLMDELSKFPRPGDEMAMASTQHVTDCRLVVSTPLGSEGAYFELMHEESNMKKVILDWKQNPTRNRGLYRFEKHVPVAIDEENPLPPEYLPPTTEVQQRFERLRKRGFKLEGTTRSPWYDYQCDRPGATPQNIAQELDRDYGGSSFRVFGNDFMDKAEATRRAATHVGDIDFDTKTLDPSIDFVENGPLKLWLPVDAKGKPPHGSYVIGCDVSNGLGGSFTSASALIAFDVTTGEHTQVAEWASRTVPPQEFADLAISFAKWLNDAFLCWEHNGPGSGFTSRVLHQKYSNIYYRRSLTRRKKAKRMEPGWWTDEKSKVAMFSDLRQGVRENAVVLRSPELIKECQHYVYKNGKIEHGLIAGASDDAKGVSHGDRVIAAAIAIQAAKDTPTGINGVVSDAALTKAPVNSFAGRHAAYEEELARNKDRQDGWVD